MAAFINASSGWLGETIERELEAAVLWKQNHSREDDSCKSSALHDPSFVKVEHGSGASSQALCQGNIYEDGSNLRIQCHLKDSTGAQFVEVSTALGEEPSKAR